MINLRASLYILVRATDLDIGADSVFEPGDRFAGINRAERPLRRAFTIERERLVKGMSVAIEPVGQRVQIHTLVAKGELTAALFRYLQRFAPGQDHGLLEVWWRDTGHHGVPEHGKMEGSPQTGHHQLRLLLLEQLVVVGVRRSILIHIRKRDGLAAFIRNQSRHMLDGSLAATDQPNFGVHSYPASAASRIFYRAPPDDDLIPRSAKALPNNNPPAREYLYQTNTGCIFPLSLGGHTFSYPHGIGIASFHLLIANGYRVVPTLPHRHFMHIHRQGIPRVTV